MPSRSDRVVVVGASVAGLLAAAALAPHHADVIVLDRDRLPSEPVPRRGVPHARHCHLLPHAGWTAIDSLLPGLRRQRGGAIAPAGGDSPVTGVERHLLEAGLRDRVAALPSVRLRGRTTVLDLVVPIRGRIAGVIAADLDRPGEPARTLPADLVVDASGRGSRLLECLQKHGSPVPPVDRRRVDGLHVTRRFTLPDGLPMPGSPAANGVVVAGSAAGSAILVRVGERAWTVSLAGYRGVRPPLDLPGFIGHARAAGGPVADLLEALRPDGDPLSSWEPALVHRRFDLLREPLDGLVVVGDARCTLDAASGAGVAAAAMQAVVLREAAAGGGSLPGRYHRATAAALDELWRAALDRHSDPADVPGDRR